MVAASLALTVLAASLFRRDPGRRRTWLALLAPLLALAPWWPTIGPLTWPLGLSAPAAALLAEPLPWLAAILWWGVAAALIARLGFVVQRERHRLETLPAHPDAGLVADCRALARQLGLSRPVAVRLGAAPCASTLAGLTVVLPGTLGRWSAEARAAVLAHELAHLAQRNDRQMLLVRMLVDWYWWMPWLRGLYRRYVEAMEESCDDRASRLLPSRSDYVRGLVDAARRLTAADAAGAPAGTTLTALLGHSHLGARAARLIERPRPTLRTGDGRGWLAAVLLPFVLATTMEPVTAARPWPADARPLRSVPPATDTGEHASSPRVTSSTSVRLLPGGTWRPVPDSARGPRPVYPIDALAHGLGGTVIVEQRFEQTPAGLVARAAPQIVSRDGPRPLARAVARALARPSPELAAGLRGVVAGSRFDAAGLRPGAHVQLRTVYRFVPGRDAHPPAGKEVPQ
ncbi:MAG TPA: M56 family metallopeptidase [Pseudomonadales bacterium]